MALQEGSSGSVDVISWLKTNNLEPLVQTFQDRSITLEELAEIVEFGDEELASFAKELSDDTNIQQNLIKAAKNLSIEPAQNDNLIAAPAAPAKSSSINMMYPTPTPKSSGRSQHVIVSPAEHKAILTLFEKYDMVSKLRTEIQTNMKPLESSTETAIKTIEDLFDNILKPQILSKKQQLLGNIDTIYNEKDRQLKQQLREVDEYINIVDKVEYVLIILINIIIILAHIF